MMRVLPDRLGYDQGSIRIDAAKNLDAFALTGDEAMLFLRIIRMRPIEREVFGFHGFRKRFLHRLLRWPACLIRLQTQIAAGDELNGGGLGWLGWHVGLSIF